MSWILAISLCSFMGSAVDGGLVNGDFSETKDGLPVGWSVSIGATNDGGGELSRIAVPGDGSLRLSGDRSVGRWRYLSQSIPARATGYRLKLEARGVELRRENNQFDNAYVALVRRDAGGQLLGRQSRSIHVEEWCDHQLVVRTGEAARVEVAIFLSKSGALEVRGLSLEPVEAKDSLQLLVDDMSRYYAQFKVRSIDWTEHSRPFLARKKEAESPVAFMPLAMELLSPLGDLHIWIDPPIGRRVPTHRKDVARNYDYRVVSRSLEGVRQIGNTGFVGRTEEGFGYVAIGTLSGRLDEYQDLVGAMETLLDAPGMIIDLRANGGGDERRARMVAEIFADQERVYARARMRSGPRPDDLVEVTARRIAPRRGKTYTRPVVCLIGPGCVSSGEGFVAMLDCLPHVTLVGLPTRGASGNPAPIELPNGYTVHYSRWVSLLPDGTGIEMVGIPPDRKVEHAGPGDPTFEAARAELRKLTRKSR